jgi:hypothetical protein
MILNMEEVRYSGLDQPNRNLKFKGEINKETSPKEYCSWEEVDILTKTIAQKIRNSNKNMMLS